MIKYISILLFYVKNKYLFFVHVFIFQAGGNFTEYQTDPSYENTTCESCNCSQTIRYTVYPDANWNNTVVRCAVIEDETAVLHSETHSVVLAAGGMEVFCFKNLLVLYEIFLTLTTRDVFWYICCLEIRS